MSDHLSPALVEIASVTNDAPVSNQGCYPVRLTPIDSLVPGYQKFLEAPSKTIVGLVKK